MNELSKIGVGGDVVVEMAEDNLRRLHTEVAAAIEAAQIPIQTVAELAGPNPAPLPGQLKTLLNMGTGYFRTVNATIERLFRERNARLSGSKFTHEKETNPSTRGSQSNDCLKLPSGPNPQSPGPAESPAS